MKTQVKYTPINCSYYDELEAYATLKKRVPIVFLQNGEITEIQAIITKLETVSGQEFLYTDTNHKIRLDFLQSVGGKQVKYYC